MLNKIKKYKKDLIILFILLLVSGVAHGYNMFHFPYYENDEGTYMAQAWSLVTQGKLAPYTYWYDHAPAGWILIAIWTKLTGGFFTFGFSVNSGRVLMLVLHIFSSLILYFIGKRLTGSRLVGVTATLLFSLSPLAIYFQRRVLLDNIMVFWVLLSLLLITNKKIRLRDIILSAVFFGIGVLSKENAIFFIPIFIYILYSNIHSKHKILGLIKWIAVIFIVISLYIIYAVIKGELFPSGTLLGGTQDHVSLISTLKFQGSRSGGGFLDFKNSDFFYNMNIWINEDPFLILAGFFSTFINTLIGIRNKIARITGLLSLSMIIFLIRGGVVIEFYVIPLVPLLALNIPLLIYIISNKLSKLTNKGKMRYLLFSVFSGLIIFLSFINYTNVRNELNLFKSDQTTPQVEAIKWILSENNSKAVYIIDSYGYLDLHDKNNNNFQFAEWYWKLDSDPEVKKKILSSKVNRIDYLAVTPQMSHDIYNSGLNINGENLKNAEPFLKFWNDGWGVEFWATKNSDRILETSWESYKREFIHDGKIIKKEQKITTSEGQSYALLRAAWIDDKQTFDNVYKWTKQNLQNEDKLFIWKYDNEDDLGTASDADQDIALALIFAYKNWGDDIYLQEARNIMYSIWKYEVVILDNKPYLSAGNWANKKSEVIMNPSHLSPSTYRIFAQVDKSHNWQGLIDTTYEILEACTENKLDSSIGKLPPEWCAIDKETLEVKQPADDPKGSEYGYNAFRVPWRIALDHIWYKEPKAKKYLESLSTLYEEYNTSHKISAVYKHDGSSWENYESVAAYGGNIGYFIVTNPEIADKIYNDKILKKFY